jgi:acyl carrier protein
MSSRGTGAAARVVQLDRAEVVAAFEELYRRAKPDPRPVRADAKLRDDLDVDSVLGFDLLISLEERFDVELVDDPALYRATSVGELADLVCGAFARRAESSTGPAAGQR